MESTTQIYFELTLESGSVKLGEAAAGGYEQRIDIDSFQFQAGAKKQTLKDVQSGVVGNLDFERVTISKVFDRASLLLTGVLGRHERFVEAKISVDQQYVDPDWVGKERNEILIIYLRTGYVADIKLRTSEGSTGASIKEDITLSFENCLIYYYAEDRGRSGKLGDDYRWEPCIFETTREVQEG
ncbi:MAG: type VI secretion system tube protein Hcp [Caldimonas sp.]